MWLCDSHSAPHSHNINRDLICSLEKSEERQKRKMILCKSRLTHLYQWSRFVERKKKLRNSWPRLDMGEKSIILHFSSVLCFVNRQRHSRKKCILIVSDLVASILELERRQQCRTVWIGLFHAEWNNNGISLITRTTAILWRRKFFIFKFLHIFDGVAGANGAILHGWCTQSASYAASRRFERHSMSTYN